MVTVDNRLVEAFRQGYIHTKNNPNPVMIKSVNYDGIVVDKVINGYVTTVTYTPSTFGKTWGLTQEDLK